MSVLKYLSFNISLENLLVYLARDARDRRSPDRSIAENFVIVFIIALIDLLQ